MTAVAYTFAYTLAVAAIGWWLRGAHIQRRIERARSEGWLAGARAATRAHEQARAERGVQVVATDWRIVDNEGEAVEPWG